MTAPISTASMTGPETSAAEQSRMELQAKLNGLGGLNGRKLSPEAKEKKLREACEGFESIFIQKMWQEMRNAVPKTGILTGREERFWQDMYDQELSKSMTSAGGIGLADMMFEQLSRNLVSVSRSTAGLAQGGAFVPQAAPLLAEAMPDQLATPTAAAVYESEAPQMATVAHEEAPASQQTQAAPAAASLQPPVQQAPQAEAPKSRANAAAIYGAAANSAHATRGKIHAADLGQSAGMINAQKAMREAGDKLGSRAVRPAQRKAAKQAPSAAQPAEAPAQVAGLEQAGGLAPGTPEALKAAMEMAKAGYTAPEQTGETPSLSALVANVQAKNAVSSQPQTGAQQPAPVTRKIRRTTNIPKTAGNGATPKNPDVIRTLNVDNVGVNSKAGQGLKAYQAQRETRQAAAGNPATSSPAAQQVQEAQAIPPLTAHNQTAINESAQSIPPLTATGTQTQEMQTAPIPPLTAPQS